MSNEDDGPTYTYSIPATRLPIRQVSVLYFSVFCEQCSLSRFLSHFLGLRKRHWPHTSSSWSRSSISSAMKQMWPFTSVSFLAPFSQHGVWATLSGAGFLIISAIGNRFFWSERWVVWSDMFSLGLARRLTGLEYLIIPWGCWSWLKGDLMSHFYCFNRYKSKYCQRYCRRSVKCFQSKYCFFPSPRFPRSWCSYGNDYRRDIGISCWKVSLAVGRE